VKTTPDPRHRRGGAGHRRRALASIKPEIKTFLLDYSNKLVK